MKKSLQAFFSKSSVIFLKVLTFKQFFQNVILEIKKSLQAQFFQKLESNLIESIKEFSSEVHVEVYKELESSIIFLKLLIFCGTEKNKDFQNKEVLASSDSPKI